MTILARHPARVHEFDADSRWMGPLGLARVRALADGDQRRGVIARERHRGSVPAEIARQLESLTATARWPAIGTRSGAQAGARTGASSSSGSGAGPRGTRLLSRPDFTPAAPAAASWMKRSPGLG